MLRNYFKTAVRNLLRHRLYTFINLFGLATGIAFVILIFLFIRHEFSFDRFFENKEHIYRVEEVEYSESGQKQEKDWLGYYRRTEGIGKWPYLPVKLGPTLKEEVPEIRQFLRVDRGDGIVQHEDIVDVEDLIYTDANFFEFFSLPLSSGDPATVLDEKNKVVLTPGLATKYFGRKDPVGESLILTLSDSPQVYTVSGIAERPPVNSSIDFQMLVRIENRPFYQRNLENWNSFNTPLFVEMVSSASLANVKAKIDAFTERQFAEFIEETRTRYNLSGTDKAFEITLTPLTDVHLDTSVDWLRQGDARNILILGGIALLILIIACLNYISLSLTSASGRMKEVGVRKVLGSTPRQIARQFWFEAQLLVLVAILLAIGLVELLLPSFNGFAQRTLSFGPPQYLAIALPLLGVALLTGLLSGSYPATVISRFRPVSILQSNNTYRYQPRFIKGAVVVQFALSVFLIMSSLVMSRQMQYINRKDLGYDEEQVLVLDTHTGWNDEGERLMERLRETLKSDPQIKFVSGTSGSFSRGWNINSYEMPDGERHRTYVYRGDYDYLDMLDIGLVAGRNFSRDHPTDVAEAIIVNEAMLADLGIEGDPIGQEVPWRKENNRKIIGVTENFHFLSLAEEIQPMLIHVNPEQGKIQNLLIKLDGKDIPAAIAAVEHAWKEVAPDTPFDYAFLDEDLAQQYETYRRWTNIMFASTAFAIIIACLGLFGLAGILAVNKRKEISIRKVLGASLRSILMLLNRDLVKLTLISLLIAGPLAWYAMQRWLDNFQYHIELKWSVFLVAGLTCLLLVVLTVSYHSLRSALRNPVDALRNE
jgi:putative ABC transport system permease protein